MKITLHGADSPMAIEASRIYRSHPDLLDDETRDLERASKIARAIPM